MSAGAAHTRPRFSTKHLAGAAVSAGAVAACGLLANAAQATAATSYYNACANPKVNHYGGYGAYGQKLRNSVNVAGYLCSGTGRPYACTGYITSFHVNTYSYGPYCNAASSHAEVSVVAGNANSRYDPYGRVCGQCGGHSFNREQFMNAKASR